VNTFGRLCGTIDPGSCIRWVLGFGIKTGYDSPLWSNPWFHKSSQSHGSERRRGCTRIETSSSYDVEEEADQCHLHSMRRNRPGINKVTYIAYKEWSGHALMNEIKETNYDVNVLCKGNIVCLWVLENDLVSMIAADSNFIGLWYWLCWKTYLLSFLCIWRSSKLEVVRVLCINLKSRWSLTQNWKQTWEVNKHD
jgi:hypothetical protein